MANYRFYRRVFAGGPLFGAGLSTQVTVINLDTLGLAPIFTDEAGTTPKSNPFNISEVGKFDFWVAAGNYRVTAVTGGESDPWEGRIGPYTSALVNSYPSTTISTATHTLVIGNSLSFLDCTNVAGCAITVPPQSSVAWADDTEIIGNSRLDTTTFVAGSGVTINKADGKALEANKMAPWALRRLEEDEWLLTGYLVDL